MYLLLNCVVFSRVLVYFCIKAPYCNMLWQPLTKMVNSILSSLIMKKSCGNYKKTQQKVSNILLLYLYYRYIVYTSNK